MAKFAVIETGGKQYKVAAGQKIQVEKLPGEAGDSISFDKVLLVGDGDKAEIGAPYLAGTAVTAKIVQQAREKKKLIMRYHSKTRYRKHKGHRQHFTELEIVSL